MTAGNRIGLVAIFVIASLCCTAIAPAQGTGIGSGYVPDRSESWQAARKRLLKVVRQFGDDRQINEVLDRLKAASTESEIKSALKPLVWLRVSVNPESRVKINAVRDKVRLRQHQARRFLVLVENTAGITAPLNLTAIDLATHPPEEAGWCEIAIVESRFTSRFFSGAGSEYKVMQITPGVAGLRELRITGDAGQGTQDLGFRATADVMLEIDLQALEKSQ